MLSELVDPVKGVAATAVLNAGPGGVALGGAEHRRRRETHCRQGHGKACRGKITSSDQTLKKNFRVDSFLFLDDQCLSPLGFAMHCRMAQRARWLF